MPNEDAQRLRERAAECRELAAKCRTTETHDLLLTVAVGLEDEADKMDTEEPVNPPIDIELRQAN